MTVEDILQELQEATVEGDIDKARQAAETAIKAEIAAPMVVKAAAQGMVITGQLFETGEYFVADLIASAEAMKAAIAVVEPLITASDMTARGKVVIGSVQGDVHDIGKNLVGTVMRAAGFEVIDLGINVTATRFVDEAVRLDADIIAMSAYSSTVMVVQRDVLTELQNRGLRNNFICMVGGAPTNAEWAKTIGADGWAPHAWEAAKVAAELVGRKQAQRSQRVH